MVFLLNMMVFWHAASATLAAAVLAKTLATKIAWQNTESLAKSNDSADRRQAIESLFSAYSRSLIPGMVLFLLGGFVPLLAYRLLLSADHLATASPKTSSFLRPFVFMRRLLGAPGEVLATIFVLFAAVFIPAAYVLLGVKTFFSDKEQSAQWHFGSRCRCLQLGPAAT